MPTQNEKIVEALNCVSKADFYFPILGSIFSRKLGFAGEYVEIESEKAVQELETRIKEQRCKLEQAEATLREIRESGYADAKAALARASGD